MRISANSGRGEMMIARYHQAQLEQLTGCRYAVMVALAGQVRRHLLGCRKPGAHGGGRPLKLGTLTMTSLTLMKLRQSLTLRSMEALTGVDAVTLSRYVNRVVAALATLPLAKKKLGLMLVVDTTSVRVATTRLDSYSGHKHHRCAKSQVLARTDGQIVDVSQTFPGSAHDKTIWNKQLDRLRPLMGQLVLADKAYAGARGEAQYLLRPLKRGENAYKGDKDQAKAFNRGLSKVRVRIEHVFARLKTWRVLAGIFPYRWERLGEVIRALAVVHNMNRIAAGADE